MLLAWVHISALSFLFKTDKQICLVSESLPLAIILVGIIGGLILTAALILMLLLCRRHLSRSCPCSNRFKSGSDIDSFADHRSGSKRNRKSGSSDSENSADYKIDIRTTSSMSNQDSDSNWDELDDRPTTTTTTSTTAGGATTLPGHGSGVSSSSSHNNNSINTNGSRTHSSGRYPPQVMTNGGLVYHQHYANTHLQSTSLQRPGTDYVDAGRILSAAKTPVRHLPRRKQSTL